MADSVEVFAMAQSMPVLVHGVVFILQVSLVILSFQAADFLIASVQTATLDLQQVKPGYKQPTAKMRSWPREDASSAFISGSITNQLGLGGILTWAR